jgi:hypothetical protein
MSLSAFIVVFVSAVLLTAAFAQVAGNQPGELSVVPAPPSDGANSFYVGNRPPLVPDPLIKLPIGRIKPAGWLRGQLELMRDGMTGHLPELSQWCKPAGNAWLSPVGEGEHGWEELPYWLKGFGDLGYVLADQRIISESRRWLDGILASQEADGYFGPRENKRKRDLWPNMPALDALRSFHEATGDPRVIPFMTRYFRWQMNLKPEDLLPESWQKVRGGDNLASIHWLYNRTGDPWLLELGKRVHERTVRWDDGVANWHGVNITQGFREPAVYYVQAGDRKLLDAAERNYHTVMGIYGQVPGGMFGADENCREGYTDPRQAAETCSMVEFMHSFQMLLGFTGDPKFADRCEEVAFNSLPAASTADLKALHYLTAPNQVQLDSGNKSPGLQNGGCMVAYSPDERYRCCQHNVAMGWPYFAEHLWMATRDNGLAAVLYSECEVKARVGDGIEVTIAELTSYPFDENISLTVSTAGDVEFPLYLRIPGWCRKPRVLINGRLTDPDVRAPAYVRIARVWKNGDTVQLVMPMQIDVRVWEKDHNAVSVGRGPLTYSLKIGEGWRKVGDNLRWPDYEVFPTTPWNYGLVLDPKHPARSFVVLRKAEQVPPQPWTATGPAIELRALARRIPNWQMDHLGLVGTLQPSPVRTSEPVEEVALIPMGGARLRITAFPTVSDAPDAHEWTPPSKPKHLASHYSDDPGAISDGKIPENSNDHSIPRFTWWDHRGTTEWVVYALEQPRRVWACELYWFDDTGVGECRVPASWRILYRAGDEFREVKNARGYECKADQFNRVTFDPVETSELKLEVKLQPNYSGGILEWRIAE